jgi:DNA/RNA endonuclease G (NUC1)
MTNILPQAANMNRGTWLLTEEIIECYRDIDELLVIGGVIGGTSQLTIILWQATESKRLTRSGK